MFLKNVGLRGDGFASALDEHRPALKFAGLQRNFPVNWLLFPGTPDGVLNL